MKSFLLTLSDQGLGIKWSLCGRCRSFSLALRPSNLLTRDFNYRNERALYLRSPQSPQSRGITMLRLVMLFAVWCFPTDAYKSYQGQIPNGAKVQHPCYPSRTWDGVGHRWVKGGGAQNPFGLDFAALGKRWSRDLCAKDSDGDGRSNGEELGDPGCRWLPGRIPDRHSNVTHPGVCEPLNSEQCKKKNAQWDICQTRKKK